MCCGQICMPAPLDDHGRDSVVWALVVRRAHGLAVTRDLVAELTDRARCLRRAAVA